MERGEGRKAMHQEKSKGDTITTTTSSCNMDTTTNDNHHHHHHNTNEEKNSNCLETGSSSKNSNRGGGGVAMVVAVGVAVLLLAWDPFRLSIVGNDPTFQAKRVKQPIAMPGQFPSDSHNRLRKALKWEVPEGVMGPESLAMDPRGNGPYTGVADGRIIRWVSHSSNQSSGYWQEFAHTSPNRFSTLCEPGHSQAHVLKYEHMCGRPLGLRFHKETGDLYIADAYFGLLKVGPNGGLATTLSNVDNLGMPLRFTNDVDVASDGIVYFTDSSYKYQRRNFFLLVLSGDDSGRLLRYDPKTKETNVVLSGLQFPNGVALSKDESFLVIAESVPGRLLRYWLKGPRVGQMEVMSILPGYPDNVRINDDGDFWVAMHCRRNLASIVLGIFPWLRRAFLQLPIPFKYVYRFFNGGGPHGLLAKYSTKDGQITEVLEDNNGLVVKYASQVHEQGGHLWIGSVLLPYVAIYDL